MKEWISQSAQETRACAGELAAQLKAGDFVLLHGDLGAGKTEWVKGFAAYFGFEGEVASPTFNLVHEYRARLVLYHWDLYRLDEKTDWSVLDLQEHLAGSGITIVEWPERCPHWQSGAYHVKIEILGNEGRRIICES